MIWGKRYENEKKMAGAQKGNVSAKKQSDHNDQVVFTETTCQKIAGEYGIGDVTIRRDEQFAKGIDLLPPTLKSEVLSGETPVTKNDMMSLAKMEDGQQKKAVLTLY